MGAQSFNQPLSGGNGGMSGIFNDASQFPLQDQDLRMAGALPIATGALPNPLGLGQNQPLNAGALPQPVAPAAPAQDPLMVSKNNLSGKFNNNLLSSGDLVSLQRSELFAVNDRYDQEQYVMKPLRAGGGPLGITRIILDEKVTLLNLDKSKTLTNDQMLEKLRIDGVYVDDPQIYQKFTDINMQKLEERILREMPFQNGLEAKLMENGNRTKYFKMNGEIKLNNDLLADEITRPADLAFESTEAYQTKEVNSILCNRLHSFKKRYYRLDVLIGKICLQNYPQFFNSEDKLAIDLRELYKEYERRTSLAMIPFYMQRVKFIENEQYTKMRNPLTPKPDLDFLQQNLEETQRKLDQEKREVQDLAQQLYAKWKSIKEVRKTQGFSSTNVKMRVHKNEQLGEFYFNMMFEEPSAKKYNDTALPSSEVSRRNNSMRIRAYCRLIINGRYVSRTKKAFLKWPNFEIEVSEQFQVYLFTMPSSIQLEIVVGTFKEYLVDVIDVEVPGKHVKALTSASQLVKEIAFSKFHHEKKKLQKKFFAESKKAEGVLSEAQKVKLAQEEKKRADEEKKAIDNDIKGLIYIKAEWKGEGPEMPPMRSENIFKQQLPHKVRKSYNEDEQHRMLLRQLYIDVNDPRNERIIRFIKETKNEFLIKLLQEDAKNPLSSLTPFRHLLLDARAKDPDFSKEQIPLLECEIIENQRLLDKLEVLYREQAYREYLEKKVEEERMGLGSGSQKDKVYIMDYEDNAVKYDSECIRRRQLFFDKLKRYAREVKAGHQKASTQYKGVVREFELLESESPLIAIFNKLFITGRKLRPVIQKRQPVALDSCKEAKIMVHVIKGFNVPIRNQAKRGILEAFQRQGFASGIQDPYNTGARMGGPYPLNPNQGFFGQTQNNMQFGQSMNRSFGGGAGPMAGMSSGGGIDPSMMRNINANNRMTNGVPLNVNSGGLSNQSGLQVGDIRSLTNDQLRRIYTTNRVEPMVEVRIVYNEEFSEVKVTNASEGDFPEWNEILEFPLMALNKKKFTKHELINTKSMLYITLFDREITSVANGRVQLEMNYRYLGSFSIPLIAILNNPPKIDAIFKINRPMALFNYQVETNSFFFLNQGNDQQNLQQKKEIPNTYISMSVSLEPVLELPQDNEFEYYPGRESTALLIAVTEWTKSIKKGSFEKRYIRGLGENVDGQSVLLCRYIVPQAPPTDVYNTSNQSGKMDPFAIEKAARYVSLIPFIEDNAAFQDMPDLYCNSQEFLDLGAGDFEEHAILLCNYFNYIDQQQGKINYRSYLVLGTGFPEGRTAYVLRRNIENNHVELWNPMKAEAYFYGRQETKENVGCLNISKGFKMDKGLNDAICQLRSVGCIISNDNVWANVQSFDDPGLLNFNMTDTGCWKPFFNKSNLTKYFPGGVIRTDQPDSLYYMRPMEPERAEVIALKIQSFITEKFENERIAVNRMITKWKNDIEGRLKDILAKCEIRKQNLREGGTNSTLRDQTSLSQAGKQNIQEANTQLNNIQNEIESISQGSRAWGFPINGTFISLPLLWEEVKNTKVHMIYDDGAEFSLQVYVMPYSHNVLSVWFFLLAFTKEGTVIRGAGVMQN